MLYAKVNVETRIGAEVLEWAYSSISGPIWASYSSFERPLASTGSWATEDPGANHRRQSGVSVRDKALASAPHLS